MGRDAGKKAMKTGLLLAGLAAVLVWMRTGADNTRPPYAMAVGEDSDSWSFPDSDAGSE